MAKNNVGQTLNTDGVIKAMVEASKDAGTPILHKDAANFLGLLKQVVADALATGQKVQLTGFLSFNPSYRSARRGNNVMTSEPMDIPESVAISVRAGKTLRDVMKSLDATIVTSIKDLSKK